MAHVNIFYNRVQDTQTIILFCFPVPISFPPNMPEPTNSVPPVRSFFLLSRHICFTPYNTLPFFNPWESKFDAFRTASITPYSNSCPPSKSCSISHHQSKSETWDHLQIHSTFNHRYNASPVIFHLLNISQMLLLLSLYFSS